MNASLDASDTATAFAPRLLTGKQARVARVIWLVLVGLSIVVFVAAVPMRYEELMNLASNGSRPIQQLSPAEAQLLQSIGISLRAYASVMLALEVMIPVIFIALSLLIFVRESVRESSHWVTLLTSLGLATYAMLITPVLDAIPESRVAWYILSAFVQSVGLQIALSFFYLFPNGRFAPRWTAIAAIAWAVTVWSAFFFPGVPWRFVNPWTLSPLAFLALMAWWLSGLVAQFVRLFHTRTAIQRQQTKWVVYSVTLAVFGYAVAYLPRVLVPDLRESGALGLMYNLTALPIFFASVAMVPIAITFSILRYRLWEIDRLIGRTLIYGMVSAALALIYVGAILLLQQLLQNVLHRVIPANTRQTWVLAVVLSTIAVAWLASPLRSRIQASVDRRFFRAKYDADRTVDAFSTAVRDTVNLDELTAQLVSAVSTTLQPSQVSVWIRDRNSSPSG